MLVHCALSNVNPEINKLTLKLTLNTEVLFIVIFLLNNGVNLF